MILSPDKLRDVVTSPEGDRKTRGVTFVRY